MSALFTALSGNMNLLDLQALEANRRNEITEIQNSQLNRMLGWEQGCGVVLFILFITPMLFFLPLIFFGIFQDNLLIPILVAGVVFLLIVLFTGKNVWKLWDNFARLKRDRENRAIRQAQGQLSYSGNGYVFQANDRTLRLPAQSTGGLLPGATYRVYYLEESGFVLSAEEIFPANPAQLQRALRDILAAANSFSLEDLEANRNGEVTASQRRKALPRALAGAFFSLLALVFGGFFYFVFADLSSSGGEEPFIILLLPGIVGGIFLLVGGIMFVNAMLDMTVSTLQHVDGIGHKEKRVTGGKNRRTYYYYVINGQRFEVSYRAFAALIDGLEYRLYHLPRTKRLIAIDPLDVTPGVSQAGIDF
jgi:hypothetical protein